VRSAATVQLAELDAALAKVADNTKESPRLRLEALRAVVLRRPELPGASFDLLIGQLAADQDPLTRLTAAEVLGRTVLTEAQITRLTKPIRSEALIPPAVLLPALERSATAATTAALLDYLTDSLKFGWRPTEAELARVLTRVPKEKAAAVRRVWQESK